MVDKVFGLDFSNETTPTGTSTISVNNGSVLVDVELQNLHKALTTATETQSGAIELATNAEALLGTDSTRAITAAVLAYLGNKEGWRPDTNTWTYSSADSPTFVISINADMTTTIYPGYKFKLTQTTTKYFIVTAVGTFSAGATLVTVYGGTDYTLANAAISSPYWSNRKAPAGFPLAPDKWTVSVTDTSDRSQASPVTNTWYNLGSLTISIPIGVWSVNYKVLQRCAKAASTLTNMASTLSTGTTTESDSDLSVFETLGGASGSLVLLTTQVSIPKILTLAAKTSYYLNGRTTGGADSIGHRGDSGTTVIRAVCAYL